MKKSHLLGAACAFTLFMLTNTAQAALVASISSLNIDGTLYDVTFHVADATSFAELWDSDGDGIFGEVGDTSVFNAQPTFWGDATGAANAATAITAYLGTADWTSSFLTDKFFVPYEFAFGGPSIATYTDNNGALATDGLGITTIGGASTDTMCCSSIGPYASFQAVPVPAAVWLFGSGLLGLIGISRRKKSV